MKLSVCDDNTEYLTYLTEQITNICGERGITASIDTFSPEELSERLKQRNFDYDIIFLDIRMNTYDGISLAKRINDIDLSCSIVFVSNYLNLATEVYDVRHTYFILKSELEQRLPLALDRALNNVSQDLAGQITITSNSHKIRLQADNILYAEVYGHRLTIYYSGDKSFHTYQTLKWLHRQLPYFIKIHSSYLVNPTYILSLGNGVCALTNGTSLPNSRSYAKKAAEDYSRYLASLL